MMRRNTRMSVKDMAPRRGGAPDIKYIRAAAITALVGNAVLAALKLAVGIISGSAALLGDGIDSSADVLIAVVTLAVVKIMARPADAEHPWGHARAETVSVAVLSFILFFAGAQLIIGSVTNMLSGAEPKAPGTIAIIAAAVSIAGKLALACSQYALYRRSGSAMIRASAKNMAGDVLISLGVIAGLIISSGTGSALADVIIAAAVGMWVIKTAAGIFLEANQELMDGGAGAEQYRAVFSAVRAVSGAGNPHRAR
ncbi:MAG: cation diffusion facilitator family transporter, partial [Oscillospiraceae bacterium]|nr:cation diffusion facilitator family transporter [Oscillospiraceae bacterium]